MHERLSELGYEAMALADRIDGVAAQDWTRQGFVSDGHERHVHASTWSARRSARASPHLDAARQGAGRRQRPIPRPPALTPGQPRAHAGLPEVGPVLGVVLDEVLDDPAVDAVDEHQAPLGRGFSSE